MHCKQIVIRSPYHAPIARFSGVFAHEHTPPLCCILLSMSSLLPLAYSVMAVGLALSVATSCAKTSEFSEDSGASSGGRASAGTGGSVSSGGSTVLDGGSTSTSSGGSATGGSTASGGGPSVACNEGYLLCATQCVPSSELNCGACQNRCPSGATCTEGTCVCPTEGELACSDGCVDVTASNDHCGACDNSCGTLGECILGGCACVDTATDCSGDCVDIATDAEHCGDCETACLQNAVCDTGTCACPSPFEDCTTACADLMIDAKHCGACDAACPVGAGCFDGVCLDYPCYPFKEEFDTLQNVQLDTVEGACYRFLVGSSNDGGCWNFDGRDILINGEPTVCSPKIPAQTAEDDGYIYVEVTAGTYDYAEFGLW